MCMFIMYKSMDSKQDTIEENLNQVEPRSKTSKSCLNKLNNSLCAGFTLKN